MAVSSTPPHWTCRHDRNGPTNSSQAASDLYISTSGSDSNPCSQTSPCRTIQHAADIVTAGQTVHVAPGAYTNSGTNPVVTSNRSGTSTARIVYQSDTKWGAKLISNGAYRVWLNNGDFVDIVGFDISATNGVSGIDDAHLGIQNDGGNTRIYGNRVHDIALRIDDTDYLAAHFSPAPVCDPNGGSGINNGNYNKSDNDVTENIVFNIGRFSNGAKCMAIHGIYHSNLRGHIYNNITYNNEGDGIVFWHAATSVMAVNNTTFHNGSAGIGTGAGDSPGGVTFDNSIIANNIVYDNAFFGIRSGGGEGTNNKYWNNDVYLSGPTSEAYHHIPTSEIVNAKAVDPQFVNYQALGGGDYHLKSTSPLINAGTSTGAPSTDYDGITRPQGAGFDIGAYEFTQATPTLTPLPTPTKTPTPSPSASCPKASLGDIDCDGDIDIFDYNQVVTDFGKTGAALKGDIDKNGTANLFDYNILVTNFGK